MFYLQVSEPSFSEKLLIPGSQAESYLPLPPFLPNTPPGGRLAMFTSQFTGWLEASLCLCAGLYVCSPVPVPRQFLAGEVPAWGRVRDGLT